MKLSGVLCLVLAAGMTGAAILGPLVLGVIEFHVSSSARGQLVGGEVASLVLAAPIALAAGVLWLLDRPLGPMLAFAPALYAVYMYTQYVLGPEYQRYPGNNEYAFPLYAGLVLIGWILAARAWPEVKAAQLPPLSNGLRLSIAGVLLLSSALFAAAWLGGTVSLLRGAPPAGYADDPTLFWLVRFMDLTLVIPAAVFTAVAVLRQWTWSTPAAIALVGFEALLVAAVAGMAAMMVVRHDPGASRPLAGATSALTLVLLVSYAAILVRVCRRVS